MLLRVRYICYPGNHDSILRTKNCICCCPYTRANLPLNKLGGCNKNNHGKNLNAILLKKCSSP